jgi:ADP-heptose:LPS heptosyltransferase
MSEWASVRRLLVARLDNLGDVVMCGPALRAIRRELPDCRITLWSSPGGAEAALLLPEVDDVFVTRALWQDLGRLSFDPAREQGLIRDLSAGGYDGLIVFTSFAQSPHPPAYAGYLAGIPLRAGQSKEFAGRVLSHAIKPLPDEAHQVDRNLHLVAALGFPSDDARLRVRVSRAARQDLGQRLGEHGVGHDQPIVALHPSASASARRYPPDRFTVVGQLLCQERDWRVVITGTERDRETAGRMATEIGPGSISLAGETSLPEFAALVERADLVVTNNTLTMHLADAVGTPEVVLFAGTEREEQWQPRATRARLLRRPTPCQPCYRFECPYGLPCLDIPPREVVDAALELLRLPRGAPGRTPALPPDTAAT